MSARDHKKAERPDLAYGVPQSIVNLLSRVRSLLGASTIDDDAVKQGVIRLRQAMIAARNDPLAQSFTENDATRILNILDGIDDEGTVEPLATLFEELENRLLFNLTAGGGGKDSEGWTDKDRFDRVAVYFWVQSGKGSAVKPEVWRNLKPYQPWNPHKGRKSKYPSRSTLQNLARKHPDVTRLTDPPHRPPAN